MAKRKRLSPARADMMDTLPKDLETKSAGFPAPAPAAPIAQVAGDSASAAALAELAREVKRARDEGRMVQAVPLDAVDAGYLQRDRIDVQGEELSELVASIRDRGQQTPIEVVPLGPDRYGLISGWRRLTALQQLRAETEEPGFDTVLALLRQPDNAAEAYVAMVEENEIRLGLSYYERARIAAKAVEQGIFEGEKQALQNLFSTASRAKRSKIKSFLVLYHALDAALNFPTAISERLGLSLSRHLEDHPSQIAPLVAELHHTVPETADAEQEILQQALMRETKDRAETPTLETNPDPRGDMNPAADPVVTPRPHQVSQSVARGITLHFDNGQITLRGGGVTEEFRRRLVAWITEEGV